jgi:ABC-2 type transport system ATP-binding protein
MKDSSFETPVISLENVRKSYKGFDLGPMDLTVEPGHIVAVLGANGSGKSTLFEMLTNVTIPDSGEVKLFGRTYPRDEVAIKQRIGYVPERDVGHDHMSAKTLGEFVSYWYLTWDQASYENLIRRSGIDPKKQFRKLSKGMQRRLSLALAIACGPELLLLDEPTVGVDLLARKEMLRDIWRFVRGRGHSDRREGAPKTVVFATHAVEEARQIADQVAFLADGEFLGLYDKRALLDGWKTFLVHDSPDRYTPGVVEIERGSPTRIVTGSWRETAQDLSDQGMRIVRDEPVELDEILSLLMRRSREGQRA